MERMAQSAEYFDMVFDDRVKDALENAAQMHRESGPTRVRLLLARDGAVTWTASPIRANDIDAVDLLLRQDRTDPMDVFLRHKTTRRTLYDNAFRFAQAHGYSDALFCNLREEITEGATNNMIVSIDKVWLTPPLASGVLPGVYRRSLLEQGRLSEQVLKFHDLLKAEAVYVCNSVRGLRRVRRIEQESRCGDGFETIWSDQECSDDLARSRLT
jgi:para-aminobenzoate synthetase/4-amino-4-deoxychorismate lyase